MTNIHFLLATSICQTLFEAGYTAYFAGGWVRDLLLDQPSEEIDIATSAPPSIVQELFPKTIPVGIAFGVVIVVLDGINFEVTTFRKDHPYHDGRHPDGVDFSTPEKDALRRDFTINGMFFDPLSESIYDYVGGRDDLENKLIRAIGNPLQRFSEDRLRMIRAVRFSARLGFRIEESTEAAIKELASTLFPSVSMERIWQEFNKMAAYPRFDQAVIQLQQLNLLQTIFPQLKDAEIEKLVAPFPYFPPRCPAIVFLLQLFPDATLDERLALCDYLKTSNEEKKLVRFFTQSADLFNLPGTEACSWAHFYAHPDSELVIRVRAARIYPPERLVFLEEHEARRERLKHHIERVQKGRPLITSDMLKKEGIQPGKKMGLLLKKAEQIGINENIEDPVELLNRLKEYSLWE